MQDFMQLSGVLQLYSQTEIKAQHQWLGCADAFWLTVVEIVSQARVGI